MSGSFHLIKIWKYKAGVFRTKDHHEEKTSMCWWYNNYKRIENSLSSGWDIIKYRYPCLVKIGRATLLLEDEVKCLVGSKVGSQFKNHGITFVKYIADCTRLALAANSNPP